MLPSIIRYCWLLICLWDIWAWRFSYHSEVFGLRDSQLSWYVTGVFIVALTCTVLGIGWGLSRFSRAWGFFFWLSCLLFYAYSPAFQSAGHQLLFLVFPFLFLLPSGDEPPSSLLESSRVIRIFTLVLAWICLTSSLSILLSGGFDGRIFDFYLSRDHGLNHWLSQHAAHLPWGYLWGSFLLLQVALLIYGNWRCRSLASAGFLLWGVFSLICFRTPLMSLVLILTALLLWQTSWKKIAPEDLKREQSRVFQFNHLPFRSAIACMLLLLLACHTIGILTGIRPLYQIPERTGYNSQWDPFRNFTWYPHVSLEGRSKGVWKNLIGNRADRQWNSLEEAILVSPAVSYYPPRMLSPVLHQRMEAMIQRWKIEWGEDIDRYRLVSKDASYGEFIHLDIPYQARAFEGSRSRD